MKLQKETPILCFVLLIMRITDIAVTNIIVHSYTPLD